MIDDELAADVALCQLGVGGANRLQCVWVRASDLGLNDIVGYQLCYLLEIDTSTTVSRAGELRTPEYRRG